MESVTVDPDPVIYPPRPGEIPPLDLELLRKAGLTEGEVVEAERRRAELAQTYCAFTARELLNWLSRQVNVSTGDHPFLVRDGSPLQLAERWLSELINSARAQVYLSNQHNDPVRVARRRAALKEEQERLEQEVQPLLRRLNDQELRAGDLLNVARLDRLSLSTLLALNELVVNAIEKHQQRVAEAGKPRLVEDGPFAGLDPASEIDDT